MSNVFLPLVGLKAGVWGWASRGESSPAWSWLCILCPIHSLLLLPPCVTSSSTMTPKSFLVSLSSESSLPAKCPWNRALSYSETHTNPNSSSMYGHLLDIMRSPLQILLYFVLYCICTVFCHVNAHFLPKIFREKQRWALYMGIMVT